MSKPYILLIPGSFVGPELYEPIYEAVRAKGHEIRGLHLPSVGLSSGPREGELPTLSDDAAFIAAEVEKIVESGRDVVIIAHSYGGSPTSQSVKGLSKKEREADGKTNGVARIGYMTCLVPKVGESPGSLLATVPDEDKVAFQPDEQGWLYIPVTPQTARVVFSDLPPAEGLKWSERFLNHSSASFASELTHPGYKDVPCSWLYCEDDLTLPPSIQDYGIAAIEEASGRPVDVTRIKAGHCPNLSVPDDVVAWIVDVAEKA